ncbi:MAG: hypothetical protein NC181_00430 [Clostridium sp.]|nr:hypothetical protein [Clostridium sp.]MCM1443869.1 hypothetical protein [Candidatus Amulumruptor caecigallinarius]
MKEAAGEANMTVITIVLIGLVAAAGAILIPRLLNSTDKSSCCQANGGIWRNNQCYATCSETTGTTGCSGSISTECADSNK